MNVNYLIKIIKDSETKYPEYIFGQKCKLYTCVNSTGYLYVRHHPELYKNFDGIFIDGIWMCWFLRLFWGKKITRRSFDMTSLAKDLFTRLNQKHCNESIYFIGSKQHQVEASVKQFLSEFENMNVAGLRNGYFSDSKEREQAISEIIRINPDYVIIGLGKGVQDYFGNDLIKAGYAGTVFTCGGFLHQSCDNIYYYPDWINKYNLRFLYRFSKEGTWKRILPDLFHFPFVFIFDRIASLFKS